MKLQMRQLYRDRNQWLPRARSEEKVDGEIGRWWLRSLMSLLKVMKMFQNWFWWLLHNIVNSQKPLNCVFFLNNMFCDLYINKVVKNKAKKTSKKKTKKPKPKPPVVSDHRRKKSRLLNSLPEELAPASLCDLGHSSNISLHTLWPSFCS